MKHRQDFIVGLTVIATVAALIAGVLWLQQRDPAHRRQRVVAQFSDVGNARVGNAAMIRGVKSGRIDRIELADDGAVLVRLSLDRGTELPRDPVVLLGESSLFGEWQATITERAAVPRDDAVQRQLTGAREPGLIPGATLPDIAKLTVVAGQIAGDVANVAERVEVAFDDNAARELRGSIRNFAILAQTLAKTVTDHSGDLDTLSSHLQDAVNSLNRTARKTEQIAGRVDSSMTSGDVRRMMTDFAAAAAELRVATATIASMTQRLAGSQSRLDNFLTSGDSVLMKINAGQGTLGRLVNDSSLYVDSDSLVTSLHGLVQEIRANPKRFFSMRLF